jgi:mRNA interferase MazF
MDKNFDGWIDKKKAAHFIEKRPMFNEREIWWCGLGANVGDEQDGKGDNFTRPVVILKKFNRNICLAVPLSTKLKEHPFYHEIFFKGSKQSALLLQMRVVDAKRFWKKMGKLDENCFLNLNSKIKSFLP